MNRGSLVYFVAAAFLLGIIVGGIVVYAVASEQINGLKSDVAKLGSVVSDLSGFRSVVNETVNLYQNGTALSKIYSQVQPSVVMILGSVSTGYVLGSGFVYNSSGLLVVITNNHVIASVSDLSVTFSDGLGYAAAVMGSDVYSDLAILSVNAPSSEFHPLEIVSSAGVNVGDLVVAVGNPYGLVDSATMGIVSGTQRSMSENQTGNVLIPNVIQMSAPINPGNSGGPLLNYLGSVIGMNTATLTGSEGLGFAIPSDTILKEIEDLITTGSYPGHPDLGAAYADNNYLIAQQLSTTTTYGALLTAIHSGGPSQGLLNVNDIITAANDTRIQGSDELATYLENNAFPNDVVALNVIRQGGSLSVSVKLGQLG